MAAQAATSLAQHAAAELPLVGDFAASLIEEVKVAFESRNLNYKKAEAFQNTLERSRAILQQLEANQHHKCQCACTSRGCHTRIP